MGNEAISGYLEGLVALLHRHDGTLHVYSRTIQAEQNAREKLKQKKVIKEKRAHDPQLVQ